MLTYIRVLKKGMRGNDVLELQKSLLLIGYNPNGIDSVFGNGTYNAVKSLQRDCKIAIDGIVGRDTINRINQLLSKKEDKPTPTNKKYEILRPDRQTTIVKIPRSQIEKLDVILANTKTNVETLGSMQKRTGCNFILNGGLFWTDSKTKLSHSLNLLIDEGKQNNAGIYSRYGLIIYKDNTYKFDWYKWDSTLKDMLGSSPSLVINGKINIDKGQMTGSLINARHPRSAIGMNDDYLFLVTVDGRKISQGLYGMTINELAKFMLNLGCKFAINNDGGYSTRLMHNGKMLNNCPENRPVHNAIGVFLK